MKSNPKEKARQRRRQKRTEKHKKIRAYAQKFGGGKGRAEQTHRARQGAHASRVPYILPSIKEWGF